MTTQKISDLKVQAYQLSGYVADNGDFKDYIYKKYNYQSSNLNLKQTWIDLIDFLQSLSVEEKKDNKKNDKVKDLALKIMRAKALLETPKEDPRKDDKGSDENRSLNQTIISNIESSKIVKNDNYIEIHGQKFIRGTESCEKIEDCIISLLSYKSELSDKNGEDSSLSINPRYQELIKDNCLSLQIAVSNHGSVRVYKPLLNRKKTAFENSYEGGRENSKAQQSNFGESQDYKDISWWINREDIKKQKDEYEKTDYYLFRSLLKRLKKKYQADLESARIHNAKLTEQSKLSGIPYLQLKKDKPLIGFHDIVILKQLIETIDYLLSGNSLKTTQDSNILRYQKLINNFTRLINNSKNFKVIDINFKILKKAYLSSPVEDKSLFSKLNLDLMGIDPNSQNLDVINTIPYDKNSWIEINKYSSEQLEDYLTTHYEQFKHTDLKKIDAINLKTGEIFPVFYNTIVAKTVISNEVKLKKLSDEKMPNFKPDKIFTDNFSIVIEDVPYLNNLFKDVDPNNSNYCFMKRLCKGQDIKLKKAVNAQFTVDKNGLIHISLVHPKEVYKFTIAQLYEKSYPIVRWQNLSEIDLADYLPKIGDPTKDTNLNMAKNNQDEDKERNSSFSDKNLIVKQSGYDYLYSKECQDSINKLIDSGVKHSFYFGMKLNKLIAVSEQNPTIMIPLALRIADGFKIRIKPRPIYDSRVNPLTSTQTNLIINQIKGKLEIKYNFSKIETDLTDKKNRERERNIKRLIRWLLLNSDQVDKFIRIKELTEENQAIFHGFNWQQSPLKILEDLQSLMKGSDFKVNGLSAKDVIKSYITSIDEQLTGHRLTNTINSISYKLIRNMGLTHSHEALYELKKQAMNGKLTRDNIIDAINNLTL